MCREILNTCIRNTEEAERAAHVFDGSRTPPSNKAASKGMWNMIEESELAKSIRQGGGLKVGDFVPLAMGNSFTDSKGNAETVSRAHAVLSQVESFLNGSRSTSLISSGISSPTVARPAGQDLIEQAKTMIDKITEKVQTTTDAVLLENLLGLCDKLNSAIARLSSIPSSKSPLHGLEIKTTSEAIDLHEGPADEEPLTPKVDKGKGRAEPEPEEHEKVLSPTFMITESEDEDEDDNRFSGEEDQISVPSPVVRWVTIREKNLHVLMITKGRKVGWKKKEKSSGKVPFFSDLRRWKGSTLVRSSVVR